MKILKLSIKIYSLKNNNLYYFIMEHFINSYEAYAVRYNKKPLVSKSLKEKVKEITDILKNDPEEALKVYEFSLNIPKQHVGPKTQKEWLSNEDIDNTLKEYEKIYPHFKYLNAVPIDCENYDFCSLHKNKLKFDKWYDKGYRVFGTVFNLDKMYESGSHWVAFLMSANTKKSYYYDSALGQPSSNVKNLAKMFSKFCEKELGEKAELIVNDKKHQRDGSECGVYSINFILRMLRGEPFDEINENGLEFKEINSCRNVYFKNKISPFEVDEKC
jgi:hypothetical protein